jgi:hypothetical protein
MVGQILLIFSIQRVSILGQGPVNLDIPTSETKAFQTGPRTQNGDFLKNGYNDFV